MNSYSDANNGESAPHGLPSANGTSEQINSFSHFSSQFLAVLTTAESLSPGVMSRVNCSDFAAIVHSLDQAAFARNARPVWRVNPPAPTVSLILEKCINTALGSAPHSPAARPKPTASAKQGRGVGGAASPPARGGKAQKRRRRRRKKSVKQTPAAAAPTTTGSSAAGSGRETTGSPRVPAVSATATAPPNELEAEIEHYSRRMLASLRSRIGKEAREEISLELRAKGYPFHRLEKFVEVRSLVELRVEHIRSMSKERPNSPWYLRLGLLKNPDFAWYHKDLEERAVASAMQATASRSRHFSPMSTSSVATSVGSTGSGTGTTKLVPARSEPLPVAPSPSAPQKQKRTVGKKTAAKQTVSASAVPSKKSREPREPRPTFDPGCAPMSVFLKIPVSPGKTQLGTLIRDATKKRITDLVSRGHDSLNQEEADWLLSLCNNWERGIGSLSVKTLRYRGEPLTYKVFIDTGDSETALLFARAFHHVKSTGEEESLNGRILLYSPADDRDDEKSPPVIRTGKGILAMTGGSVSTPLFVIVPTANAASKETVSEGGNGAS